MNHPTEAGRDLADGPEPDEFHAMLGQAEALHDRCTRSADEIRELARQAILLAILLLAFAYLGRNRSLGFEEGSFLYRTFGATRVKLALAGGGAVSLLAYAASCYEAISSLTRRIASDRRSLNQLLDVLREAETSLSRAGGRSPLEAARARIGLSRFEKHPREGRASAAGPRPPDR